MIFIDIKKRLFGALGEMVLDIKLNIKREEFLSISGESGSGKTTLLRILAGLEEAEGKIILEDGTIWLDSSKRVSLKPQKREIGFVFQDYALFPNMTIEKNLLFANQDPKLAKHLLEITNLYPLKDRYPNSLSGGQKQRVAIARALMRRPKLLLMDEPLSALDLEMRTKLQEQILLLHREFKITTIMVSHDLAEIYSLSNRVIILKNGKIIKNGTPKEILLNQKSPNFELIGKILSIQKADILSSAVISIGGELLFISLDSFIAKNLKRGDSIKVAINSFGTLYISKI